MSLKTTFLLLAITITVITALPTRQKRQWGIPPSTLFAEQQARASLANSQFLTNQAIADSNYLTMQAQQRQRQDLMNSQMLTNQAIMNSNMAVQRAQWSAAAPYMWG
uniref:Uncharacterized protein n=2 Tax=Bursaphelenchus xylophilus TaxID=6326 RepID=A0A1I7SCU6_BURXY